MTYFDPAVGTFFAELGANNSREWFTAHRGDYERLVREPLERLATLAGERYGPSHVTRANRDVRFSTDKSPYATSGTLWAGEIGGVYLRVDANGLSLGGGLYEPSREQLQRAREAIDAGAGAAEDLSAIVDQLQGDGFELAGPALTTAPRGYPKDHPKIALLRLRHYAALRAHPLSAGLDDITSSWRAVEPLLAWVQQHAGPAETRR